MSPKTEVVIVGGSSGAILASQISAARTQFNPAKHNLTLVTQLPYNVFLVATARMTVTSSQALDSTEQAFFPYDNLFAPGNAGRVLQGKVVQVQESPNAVILESGESLKYDYLVLATGSKWTGPSAFDKYTSDREVHDHVKQWRSKVEKSNSIVIVGGGAVGIGTYLFLPDLIFLSMQPLNLFPFTELAGEIKSAFPSKSVTLVHSHSMLVNATYPDKFRLAVAKRFEVAGVKLILGEKVLDLPEEGAGGEDKGRLSYNTSTGRTIEADLFVSLFLNRWSSFPKVPHKLTSSPFIQIPALGPKPNTSYLTTFRSGSALTPSGHVRVSPSLNVSFNSSPSPNIFALGDIIDWDEQSMIAKTPGQIDVIKKNLFAALSGQPQKAVYKGGFEGIFIPFGPVRFGFFRIVN